MKKNRLLSKLVIFCLIAVLAVFAATGCSNSGQQETTAAETKAVQTTTEETTTKKEETTTAAEKKTTKPAETTKAAEKSETKEEKTTEAQTTTQPETEYQEDEAVDIQEEETEDPDLQIEGTYYGSMEKYVDAMDSVIHYDMALTLSGGNYSYDVDINVSGNMEFSGQESYSGTYYLDGDYMSMTGELYEGSVYGDSVTVSGYFSSYAGSSDSVTLFR